MNHRIRKILVAGAAGLGMLAFQAAPTSAATAAVGVFTGSASVGGTGLSYPTSPSCLPSLCVSGAGSSWSFAGSGVGAGISGTTHSAGTFDTAVSGGTLTAGASNIGAYCGASGGKDGSGSATIANLAPGGANQSAALSGVGWLQSAATLIVFNGVANGSGTVAGLVTALPLPTNLGPPPSGNSCLNGTAKTFTVVGAAAVVA
jgi:hypothetical protein